MIDNIYPLGIVKTPWSHLRHNMPISRVFYRVLIVVIGSDGKCNVKVIFWWQYFVCVEIGISYTVHYDCFTEYDESLHLQGAVDNHTNDEYDCEAGTKPSRIDVFAFDFKVVTLAELIYFDKLFFNTIAPPFARSMPQNCHALSSYSLRIPLRRHIWIFLLSAM